MFHCVIILLYTLTLNMVFGEYDKPTTINVGVFAEKYTNYGNVNIGGSQAIAAIVLALKEINNKTDGIYDNILVNTTLRFALRETHNDFLKASIAAQDFSLRVFNGEGVIGAIGTGYDISSKAMGQTFANARFHINNIDYYANDSELSHSATYPHFARVVPSRGYGGRILAKLIKLHYSWDTVSVISTLDSYGTDISSEFFDEALSLGINIENKFTFWPGLKKFDHIIEKILSNGILEVFVLLMESEDAGHFLEAGYNAGLFKIGTQILGCQFIMKPAAWQTMSDNAPVADIMKGIISVVPIQNRNTTLFNSFLHRFLNQPSTKTYNKDGTVHCSLDTDDDGGTYLYVQQPNMSTASCAGIDFKAMDPSGRDLEDMAAFAYDAVYTLALALHDSYYNQRIQHVEGDDIADSIANYVQFEGATGLIDIFEGLGGSEGYGKGDRQTGLIYKILNFNPLYYQDGSPLSNESIRTIGFWVNDKRLFQECNKHHDNACTTPYFNTLDGKPVDGLPRIVEVQLEEWVRNLIRVGGAVGVSTVLIYLFIWVLYSDTKIIRVTQPVIMYIVFFGGILTGIQIFLQTLDITDTTCLISMWIGHLAYAVVFAAILSRTWRVGKIINSGFNKVKITPDAMYKFITFALVIFCVILVVDTVIGQPHKSYIEHFDGHKLVRLIKCTNKSKDVTFALFIIEGLVLFYGAKLCWETRDAPGSVNDSASVSLALYVILFACAVTFPIVFLSIEPTPQNLTLTKSCGYIFCLILVMHVLFGRRALLVVEGCDVDGNLNIVRSKSVLKDHYLAKISSNVMLKVHSKVNIYSTGSGSAGNGEVADMSGGAGVEKGVRARKTSERRTERHTARSGGGGGGGLNKSLCYDESDMARGGGGDSKLDESDMAGGGGGDGGDIIDVQFSPVKSVLPSHSGIADDCPQKEPQEIVYDTNPSSS